MPDDDRFSLWASITDKQHEAIDLVDQGFSSKEAARELGISPNSFDMRITGLRRKLDAASRGEALREYRALAEDMGKTTSGPTHIPPPSESSPFLAGRIEEEPIPLADAASFAEPAPWDIFASTVSEIRPAMAGPGVRMGLMLGGAAAIAAIALLTIGIAEGVQGLN